VDPKLKFLLKFLKAISPPEWIDFEKYYTTILDLYQIILIGYHIFFAPSLAFLSLSCAKVSPFVWAFCLRGNIKKGSFVKKLETSQ
jgi:hypothetical protein